MRNTAHESTLTPNNIFHFNMLKLKEGSITNSGFTLQVDELPNDTEEYALGVTTTFANGTKITTYKNITIHRVAEDTVAVTPSTDQISADGNYDFTLSYDPAGANVKVTSVKVTKATLTDMVEVVSASRDGFRIKVTGLDAAKVTVSLDCTLNIICTLSDGTSIPPTEFVLSLHRTVEYETVDLGLPSGILWATCNIGASSPEEYGLYFAWGDNVGYGQDTSDGHLFNWDTCPWGQSTPSSAVLVGSHNAAYANLGIEWDMPAKGDFAELENYCTIAWAEENDIYGVKLTSNENGNTLFFPAAGTRYDSSIKDTGVYGYYWTKERSGGMYANRMQCGNGLYDKGFSYRYFGRSVRAVRR